MKSWYAYIEGHPLDANSYHFTKTHPHYKGVGTKIAAIYITKTGIRPVDFSFKVKKKIINALMTGEPQPGKKKEFIVLMKP